MVLFNAVGIWRGSFPERLGGHHVVFLPTRRARADCRATQSQRRRPPQVPLNYKECLYYYIYSRTTLHLQNNLYDMTITMSHHSGYEARKTESKFRKT